MRVRRFDDPPLLQRAVRRWAVPLASWIALTGVAAPSPPPAGASAPLRTLEFSFAVDYEGQSESHYNGIGNGVVTGSGTSGTSSSEGGRGTMTVNVLSVAPDGALVVQIAEQVQYEVRPGAAYTCTVYGSTGVTCPSVPAPSQAEWVLLGYLGRRFVDGAPWDAQNHWARSLHSAQYDLAEDFTIEKTSGGIVTIHELKKTTVHDGAFSSRTENVVIQYDRAMEVPTAVDDDMQTQWSNGSGNTTFSFRLLADSFTGKRRLTVSP